MPRRLTDADLAAELVKQGGVVDFKFRANPKKSISPSESQIQGWVIKWWDANHSSLGVKKHKMLLAIPNGGMRDPKIGAMMKREGLRTGVSDLLLMVPRCGFPALWIEMKKPGGVMSDDQIEFQSDAKEQGFATGVCYDFDEAKKLIISYLRDEKIF